MLTISEWTALRVKMPASNPWGLVAGSYIKWNHNNAKSNRPSTSKSNSKGSAGLATSAEWKRAACRAACFGENVLFTGRSKATRPRKFGHNKSTTTWRPSCGCPGLASQRRRPTLAAAKCGRTLLRRSDIQRHPQQRKKSSNNRWLTG